MVESLRDEDCFSKSKTAYVVTEKSNKAAERTDSDYFRTGSFCGFTRNEQK